MADTRALRDIPVQAINRMVMEINDLATLERWLSEEMSGARRRSALRRIYHRLSLVRREKELRELDGMAVEKGGV